MIAEVHGYSLTKNIQKEIAIYKTNNPKFYSHIHNKTSLLGSGRAEVQCHTDSVRASVSGMVVSRNEISISAGSVARLASGRRAVAGISGGNGETSSSEGRVAAHVDAGKIPVDCGVGQCVLVLQDISLVGGGGDLDRDTATIGVKAPVFGVTLTTGGESDHFGVGCVADGPQVDGLAHVVDDIDTTSGAVVAALHGSRESRSQGAERGDGSNGLGEHHFEYVLEREKIYKMNEYTQSERVTIKESVGQKRQ
jgi:hypothetical protein